MGTTPLETATLKLVPQTRDEVRAYIARLQPHERKDLSPAWLALLEASNEMDPWIHGFLIVHRATGTVVGKCGFNGPPDAEGRVEIAYGVNPEHRGKGYATEVAAALVDYALSTGQVRVVRAHTFSERNASTRVLTKCGFRQVGEVIDPADGSVWRWEKGNEAAVVEAAMKLRAYSSSDLVQVMSVYHDAVHILAAPYYTEQQRAAWAPAITNPTRWQERLNKVRTIVMDAGGAIAGFASYEMNGHLDLLFTRPGFARRGVAQSLCRAVEAALLEAGVKKVFTEASLAARAFFESQGYRVLHEETVDCRGVELQRYAMEKQLIAA